MNVLVYHPSRQHIYKVLEGLEEYRIPYRFYTGMYFKCNNQHILFNFFKNYLRKSRFSSKVSSKRVTCLNRFEEFLFSLWGRWGLFYRERNRLLFKKQLKFQKSLLNHITPGISHIITFHTNAFFLYEWVKEKTDLNIKLILEAAQPHPGWINELYEKYPLYINEMPLNYTNTMIKKYSDEFKFADIIIAPSTFVKKTLTKHGVDEKKIIMNFYGFNPLKKTDRKLNFDRAKLQIAFTGLVSPSKGFHILKHVAKLTEKIADFHVFGHPVSRKILKNLPGNVFFHGFVSHKTLSEYYSTMDIFYFPTLYDASGLALLEAMNYGLVPIASVNSIAPDIIKHGKTGFIISPEDVDNTIHYIEILRRDRKLLKHMSETVQMSIKKFTWSEYQKKYVEIIKGA